MEQLDLTQVLKGIVPDLRYYSVTGSTNQDAQEWLADGAADGCVVIADEQTHGKGRFDRKWVTRPGSALAFTLIIRPTKEEYPYLTLFTPLAGIAVSAAIESLLKAQPQIKWPNDILMNGKKVCGILGEVIWDDSQMEGLVLGIGINVKRGSIPPAGEVSFQAGCLEGETGVEIDRGALLREVVLQFNKWRPVLGTANFIAYWQDHLAFKDQQVRLVGTAGADLSGRLVGVDQTGELILETDTGEISVQVGDVHLRLRSE